MKESSSINVSEIQLLVAAVGGCSSEAPPYCLLTYNPNPVYKPHSGELMQVYFQLLKEKV